MLLCPSDEAVNDGAGQRAGNDRSLIVPLQPGYSAVVDPELDIVVPLKIRPRSHLGFAVVGAIVFVSGRRDASAVNSKEVVVLQTFNHLLHHARQRP